MSKRNTKRELITQQIDFEDPCAYTSHSESDEKSVFDHQESSVITKTDLFLEYISQDYKVPEKYREKQPFHSMLSFLAKTLLLNEYEIVGLATLFDNANWSFKKNLKLSDRALKESVIPLPGKLDKEGKILFIHLLFMAYFVKEGLNEQEDIKELLVSCEQIYSRFQADYNSWIKLYLPTLNVVSINKKWKKLRDPKYDPKKRTDGSVDYNSMVDCIVQLTGYHSSKNDFNDLMELGRCVKEAMNKTPSPQTNKQSQKKQVLQSEPVEGPRTLPSNFDVLFINPNIKMIDSKASESVFISREASKDLIANADKRFIMFNYSRPQENEKADYPAMGSSLEELSRILRMEEAGSLPSKKVKKQDSIREFVSEEESRVAKLNLFAKTFSQFDFFDLNQQIEPKRSYGGEELGIGRVFSRNLM